MSWVVDITLCAVVVGQAYALHRSNKQNQDLVEIFAQSHADVNATLLNKAFTETTPQFLQAQKITQESDPTSPRVARLRNEQRDFMEQIARRAREMGAEPPDMPDGLG